MPKAIVILTIFLLLFSSCQNDPSNQQETSINFDQVPVEGGLISGVPGKNEAVHVFKGIPYAAAPVGELRWKAPAPVQAWEGVKKCDTFAASAIQPSPEPFYMWSEEFLIPKEPIDEDCLYLNVWTAAQKTDEKRPVVVWIHGGGFTSGGGSVPIYDGEAMAGKGVVFVNINYRVGILGFLAHPELSRESAAQASGNYGLMDQLAALKWVKQHIAAFGGDPDNITIAGQSAGSVSVVALVASPLAKGLFQKAIAQSGAGLLSRMSGSGRAALPDLQQAEQTGVRIAEELQAGSIAELRAMPASELTTIRFPAHPIIDGYVLPESMTDIYRNHQENDVSLLTGWNEDDGIVMRGFEKADVYKDRILTQWGVDGAELLGFYPATNDSIAAVSQKDLQRDLVFGAQNYTLANLVSSQGKAVYVYRFTREVPAGRYEDFGAFHTGEVPYAYDNLQFMDRPFEPADHQLAEVMSAYWTNFIISGNPNGSGLPEWPEYDGQSREIMVLGEVQEKGVIGDTLSLDFLEGVLMGE